MYKYMYKWKNCYCSEVKYTFICLFIFYFREKAEKRIGHCKAKAGTETKDS